MRIIGGTARGTSLFAPAGMETRPTQDKVKESLFNMLQAEVAGARVLDLFAGSGALALEALSRGARHATLVDRDREAVSCIRRNAEKLRFTERITLYACEWERALTRISRDGLRFDLVFLDPPYRMTELGDVCSALYERGLLLPEAMMVLEHRADVAPLPPPVFAMVKERAYGETGLHLFRLEEGENG